MAEFSRVTEALRRRRSPTGGCGTTGRVLFASASDEKPDKQGRITVPPAAARYAGLAKDCVVIGANSRIEIWDAAAWQDYLDGTEQAFADAGRGGAARRVVSRAGHCRR